MTSFNPARFAIEKNRITLVLYGLMMLMGLLSFFNIGRLEYPDFTIRRAVIITEYPGRTSHQVEQEVTEPIEQAIRQMAEVKEIESTSKNGVSIVQVELKEHLFDLPPLWQRMRNKVKAVRLPEGAQSPSINDEFGDIFPFVYALSSDGFSPKEMMDQGKEIRDALFELPGVAKVEFHGDLEERIYIEFSSNDISAYNLSPEQLAREIRAHNAVLNSGDIAIGEERITILTRGEFESLEAIQNIELSSKGESSALRLADFTNISRGYVDPPREIAHHNGQRVLCLAISMVKGGNVSAIGRQVEKRLALVQAKLPIGLDIEKVFYQPQYIDQSIEDFLNNLMQAFGMVMIVMFLFAGWRIALIVGVLVPSAVMSAFFFMPLLGVQLEMMSIAALIISLGLLVDNGVVVCEQILVKLSAGQDRKSAVIDTVSGLIFPLLGASGTTISAFLPIALASGGVGEFTYSLFAVVSLTLLSSWVMSITVIPLLCYAFLKPQVKDTLVGSLLEYGRSPYKTILHFVIKTRWLYPMLILILTAVALGGAKHVPNIFFPPNERGQFIIDVKLPYGRDIKATETTVAQLEHWLLNEHSNVVKSVSSWIGNGGPRWYLSLNPEQASPNYALLSIITTSDDRETLSHLITHIQDYSEKQWPDVRVMSKLLETGPPVGDPIQIRLHGKDMKTLYTLRDQVVEQLQSVHGVIDIRDDWGAWVKQLSVEPDRLRALRLGLSTTDIANAIKTQIKGSEVSKYREQDRSIPIVLRAQGSERDQPEQLIDMPIYGGHGLSVPLSQIANIHLEFLPGLIKRKDAIRVMTIKAAVRDRFASDALAEIQPKVKTLTQSHAWPQGYSISYGGESAESAKAQGTIADAMPTAMAVLCLILMAQFNSFRRFFIIMLTIPPMMIGVVPGLLLTNSSFGFMTLLGLIALMGIIVNNAILLIDETNQELARGKALDEAIVDATSSRLRPILMTTITTIIGLLPLALSGGGMWRSMAYAMMFGLSFATALTLLLCPCLFHLFFKNRHTGSLNP